MPKRKGKPAAVREVDFGTIGKDCRNYVLALRPEEVRQVKHYAIEQCKALQLSVSWQDVVRALVRHVAETGKLPEGVVAEGKKTQKEIG